MKRINKVIVALAAFVSTSVFAQPSTTVGTGSGLAGSSVNISVDYAGVAAVVGVQVDIEYDSALLTPTINCGSLATVLTCAMANNGATDVVRIIGFNIPTATVVDGSLATIDFVINGAAPLGAIPLTVSGEVYDDGAPPGDVPPNGSVNGSVTVISGPQPDWSSAPAAGSTLTFPTVIAGGGNQVQSITVDNVGAAGSTLTGTCAITGDAQLTITSGAAISLLDSAGTSDVNLSCDTSVAGTFTGTLGCTHNGDGTTTASPANYPLTCTASVPGQAIYNSVPADGVAIAMTTGAGVPVGATAPTATLVIDNTAALASDSDLDLVACTYAGDAAITVTSADPLTASLGPQSADTETVNFSCNTAVLGNYTGTYSCPFSTDGIAGIEGTATNAISCDVRAAGATGSQSPPSGTTLNITSPPGGSASSSVTFSEVGGEGVDITNLACSITGNPGFTLGAVPATIPAGGSVQAVVTFADPAVPGPYTDTLTCTYTDAATGPVTVTYPLAGAVRALIIPTMSTMGYIAMIFGLLLVGFFGIRRKA
jgi:hypothetical protein